MKKIIVILIIITTAFISNGFIPQEAQVPLIDTIKEVFKTGNHTELAKHFNTTVELELLEEENMFSKAQAELMVKDFFSRNKPTSFTINHHGNKANTSYAIGVMVTSSGSYRISVFMKTDKNKTLIYQLRIEKN
jgi:hypothetical protein